MAENRFEDAEQLISHELETREAKVESNGKDVAVLSLLLGECYTNQGKILEAEIPYKKALAICEKDKGTKTLMLADIFAHLGQCYDKQDKVEKAKRFYKQALAIYDRLLDRNDPRSDSVTAIKSYLAKNATK